MSSSVTPKSHCAQCQLEQGNLLRCSGCKLAEYCSAEHQSANWKTHKPACLSRRQKEPFIAHIDMERSTTDSAPWCKPFLDSITLPHSRTYALITSRTQLDAMLRHPILPSAILCTSADIAKNSYASVRAALRVYVETGGRLILGGPMTGNLPMPDIPKMFSSLGVPWKVGGYHRTTHYLNLAHPLFTALPGSSTARAALPSSYSCKAIVLKDVCPSDMLYRSTEESGVESLAMALGGGAVESDEVAVAAAKVGEGWLAWAGDVNQENGTTQAMLFLLGLKQ